MLNRMLQAPVMLKREEKSSRSHYWDRGKHERENLLDKAFVPEQVRSRHVVVVNVGLEVWIGELPVDEKRKVVSSLYAEQSFGKTSGKLTTWKLIR